MKKRSKTLLIFTISLVFLISFVLAAHAVTLVTDSTVDEDTSSIFNISIENTDTGASANISQVDITIPASFTFTSSSNGTSAGTNTFSNTATVLTWSNDGLIMNQTTHYFWFNATVLILMRKNPNFVKINIDKIFI